MTIGCTNNGTRQPIVIRHYFTVDKLKEAIEADLLINVTKDSITYSYCTDSDTIYQIKTSKNDKSSLTHFNIRSPLVDRRIFKTNGQETEILKYDFDVPNMYDEEESIYLIDNYGVIAIKGNAWNYFIQFDKGGQIEKELFKLLQQDTSGFYGYGLLPKIEIE